MNKDKAYHLQVENGVLTDNDFVGDAPPVGSSDKRYSKDELEEFAKLANELMVHLPK